MWKEMCFCEKRPMKETYERDPLTVVHSWGVDEYAQAGISSAWHGTMQTCEKWPIYLKRNLLQKRRMKATHLLWFIPAAKMSIRSQAYQVRNTVAALTAGSSLVASSSCGPVLLNIWGKTEEWLNVTWPIHMCHDSMTHAPLMVANSSCGTVLLDICDMTHRDMTYWCARTPWHTYHHWSPPSIVVQYS